jgi:hypothetical protein
MTNLTAGETHSISSGWEYLHNAPLSLHTHTHTHKSLHSYTVLFLLQYTSFLPVAVFFSSQVTTFYQHWNCCHRQNVFPL